jgi:hypothetical protein
MDAGADLGRCKNCRTLPFAICAKSVSEIRENVLSIGFKPKGRMASEKKQVHAAFKGEANDDNNPTE